MNIHHIAFAAIEGPLQEDQWDEAPSVCAITESGKLFYLMFPDQHPVSFLQSLSAGVSPLPAGDELVGLAVISEAWSLKEVTPEDRLWVKTHSLEDHPRKVEVKMAFSYDGEILKMNIAHRGETEVTEQPGGAGRIPDSLREAFVALRAATA